MTMDDPNQLYIVDVVTNPAMPGLVKIGRTNQCEADLRISQLYSTGVPFPFRLEFACRIRNADEVEAAFHIAFAPQRVNPRRDFFSIDPAQAIAIPKLLHTEDATAELTALATGENEEDAAAGERYRARRPNFNFQEMGIPVGAQLVCTASDETVTVGQKRFNSDSKKNRLRQPLAR